MSKPKIGIIVGSIREGRFADKPVEWIASIAKARGDLDIEIIDLRDYPMPLFAEAIPPSYAPPKNDVARKWGAKIEELDGFIVTAAEYSHGPTAALKNAIDYAGTEWNRKPASFVGYGGVGGARAVEQLRMIAVEMQMAPTRAAVHILWPDYLSVQQGKNLAEIDHLNQAAAAMLDDLAWWAKVLKTARDNDAATASVKAA
ncbi:MAG: NAD(P)H-dependent oxidoreductase [Pseudaminobacter sp.]|nr:NAD(P)H-dependent oxidoreductase [Pseudaminobacter sp.]